jgi:hypothetical protein
MSLCLLYGESNIQYASGVLLFILSAGSVWKIVDEWTIAAKHWYSILIRLQQFGALSRLIASRLVTLAV